MIPTAILGYLVILFGMIMYIWNCVYIFAVCYLILCNLKALGKPVSQRTILCSVWNLYFN